MPAARKDGGGGWSVDSAAADLGVDAPVLKANGQACSSGSQCQSTYCTDGVCCNTSCGTSFGNNDCLACSTAQGAAVDGTCGAPIGATCSTLGQCYSGTCAGEGWCSSQTARPGGTLCDEGDSCAINDICGNGVNSGTCLPGVPVANGTACSSQTVPSGTCSSGVCQ
jgi:hypothetical protein